MSTDLFYGKRAMKMQRVRTLYCSQGRASYLADSRKESICKEYISAFASRFRVLYPTRRELFLTPKNEHGIRKFVCSTLRPTLLPYHQIYGFMQLAEFVSRYLHFEPLDCENNYPSVLPSPSQVQPKIAPVCDEHMNDELLVTKHRMPDRHGRRLHAWAMIRGCKQDSADSVFIEPTTGQCFTPPELPYHGIEAMWNSSNYWINMQDPTMPLRELDFDLTNSASWESIFGSPTRQQNTEQSHAQGMIKRICFYKDYKRTSCARIHELFFHRHDRLSRRDRYIRERKKIEHFHPGRSYSLSEVEEVAGVNRSTKFYALGRQDGLVSRLEVLGNKIVERFSGRDDNLAYRSATLKANWTNGSSKPQYTLPCGTCGDEVVVKKMTQKFVRHQTHARSVAKRSFCIEKGQILSYYPYDCLRITRYTSMHTKQRHPTRTSCREARQPLLQEPIHELHATKRSNRRSGFEPHVFSEGAEYIQSILAAERDCLSEVRRSQLEMLELLKLRHCEEADTRVILPSLNASCKREEKASLCAQKSEASSNQVDYLTPFLRVGPTTTSIDALGAREQCLKSLKDRLIERANIIMMRLNEENAKLAKKQAMYSQQCQEFGRCDVLHFECRFQRNQKDNDPSAEDDFERFCSEAMFRIQILEQRLSFHEETALRKFQDLDDKLATDPRLHLQ